MGVFLKHVKFQYMVGKNCISEEFGLANNLSFLDKQFQLSIPLITGVRIKYTKNKKHYLHKIYVGKEINLKEYIHQDYLLDKYNLEASDIADLGVLGYERACLLNFKKYDQIMVGVDQDSIIVPDYYALKKLIFQIQTKVS